ncbi:MAG: hypothetical protein K2P99_03690, partial [Burkholderiales bacterium]|nr:hypothetical protein [Burkholderiales bacterium]
IKELTTCIMINFEIFGLAGAVRRTPISYDDITQLTDIILNSLIKNMKMYINATVNKVAENA